MGIEAARGESEPADVSGAGVEEHGIVDGTVYGWLDDPKVGKGIRSNPGGGEVDTGILQLDGDAEPELEASLPLNCTDAATLVDNDESCEDSLSIGRELRSIPRVVLLCSAFLATELMVLLTSSMLALKRLRCGWLGDGREEVTAGVDC